MNDSEAVINLVKYLRTTVHKRVFVKLDDQSTDKVCLFFVIGTSIGVRVPLSKILDNYDETAERVKQRLQSSLMAN